MWTVEEYLETWLKRSKQDHSHAQLDPCNGGRIQIALREGSETTTIEGEYIQIIPDRALRMHWKLLSDAVSLGMDITVDWIPEHEGTRMTVTVRTDVESDAGAGIIEILQSSLERMATLLQR